MTKVLTFSKTFPGYHPRAGESTYFVEKLLASFADSIPGWEMLKHFTEYDWHEYYNCKLPKGQTVRSGNRFKPGDFFSPRIWSGKPYNSKQLIISNPIEVKKVWDFEITKEGIVLINNIERMATTVQKIST